MSSKTVDSRPSSDHSLTTLYPLYWAGILLAAVTGAIHLWLGLTRGSTAMLVAAGGFALGIAAVVTGVRRRTMLRLGIPFTAGQILLYLVGHAPNFSPLGIGDKVVQGALVVVLVVILRRGSEGS